MKDIREILHQYDREFVKNALHYTLITRACRNYVVFADKVDKVSRVVEHPLNGYRTTKRIQVEVYEKKSLRCIWYFDTIETDFGQVGYRVSSWRDCIDVEVSKETGNIMYQMIMEKGKLTPQSKIVVERLW